MPVCMYMCMHEGVCGAGIKLKCILANTISELHCSPKVLINRICREISKNINYLVFVDIFLSL